MHDAYHMPHPSVGGRVACGIVQLSLSLFLSLSLSRHLALCGVWAAVLLSLEFRDRDSRPAVGARTWVSAPGARLPAWLDHRNDMRGRRGSYLQISCNDPFLDRGSVSRHKLNLLSYHTSGCCSSLSVMPS